MIVPAVMFMEAALDMLKERDPEFVEKELREFRSLGDGRLERVQVGKTDYEKGYLIGLETARVLLMGMPSAVMAKVSL